MSGEELYKRIVSILGDKTTFGFNELRLSKEVTEQSGKIKNTLDLFSFGTLKDYYSELFIYRLMDNINNEKITRVIS